MKSQPSLYKAYDFDHRENLRRFVMEVSCHSTIINNLKLFKKIDKDIEEAQQELDSAKNELNQAKLDLYYENIAPLKESQSWRDIVLVSLQALSVDEITHSQEQEIKQIMHLALKQLTNKNKQVKN